MSSECHAGDRGGFCYMCRLDACKAEWVVVVSMLQNLFFKAIFGQDILI